MHFFGSERGIFATPTRCGTYRVGAEFVPWAAALPNQTSFASFEIDSGPNGTACPGAARPFSPSFRAGTPDNTAAVATPLHIGLKRDDGDQNLAGLSVELPPGLAQSIRGVDECPQVALDTLAMLGHTGLIESSAAACPPSSRIGSVMAGSGAGTRNLYNPGRVFLAGPYKGAPLSIVAVVPALGGPYDLGNVVVRAAVFVDPVSAEIKAVSDPLPQILEGVPLRLRSLLFEFDRPGFNFAPTNCAPKAVDAAIDGSEGAVSHPSAYYQVANCSVLPFAPKLSLRLTGGTQRRGHPAIHADLRTKPGEANFKQVSVALPKQMQIDNAHIGTVCTRPQFAKRACPAGSLIGAAQVSTPLLDRPLKGAVYLRSSTHELPDLVVDLDGQIRLELAGRIQTVRGRTRVNFEDLPDARVDTASFDFLGGSKGLLINSESLCGAGAKKAATRMTGQNGTTFTAGVKLKTKCSSAARRRNTRSGRGG